MQFRTPSKNNTISNKDIEKEFKNLRKELLDLTLRNPLLSFKARNRNLSIINQTPMNAYKILVLENKKMYFSPNKAETKKSRAHTFIDQTKEFLSSESDKTLKADLTPSELQKRLFYIDQQSKTMVQEQGYNILYIALGFIEWIENVRRLEIHFHYPGLEKTFKTTSQFKLNCVKQVLSFLNLSKPHTLKV